MVLNCLVTSIDEARRVKDFNRTGGLHSRDENALLRAVKSGQTSAFHELWQPHSSRLFQTIYRITRNREDAEDALQGALLNAFVHLQTFDGRSSFRSWLTRLAINSALMIVRKNRSTLQVSLDDTGGGSGQVFDGTNDLTLNHAVGRIAGTARPGERGNIGIAGHRDGFFRGLKDIALGDTIELKTSKGVDLYAVERVSIVSPTDVTALRPRSVPSLTLVTCYPFDFIGTAPKRYIVTTSLIRETGEAGSLTPGLPSKAGNSTGRTK